MDSQGDSGCELVFGGSSELMEWDELCHLAEDRVVTALEQLGDTVKEAIRLHAGSGWFNACRRCVGNGVKPYLTETGPWDCYALLCVLEEHVGGVFASYLSDDDAARAVQVDALLAALELRNEASHGRLSGDERLAFASQLLMVCSWLDNNTEDDEEAARNEAAPITTVQAAVAVRGGATVTLDIRPEEARLLVMRRALTAFEHAMAVVHAECEQLPASAGSAAGCKGVALFDARRAIRWLRKPCDALNKRRGTRKLTVKRCHFLSYLPWDSVAPSY